MMALNLLGLALKVPLNWMFIFGHWGAPEMGSTGCALSTTLVNWAICALAWLRVGTSAAYRQHHVFSQWSWPRWRDQRHLLALGLPIGGTFFVDVTAFTFMALFVARLGAATSAAHQIAANVAAVMYMVPLAMANAVGVLVGQAIGARNFALARSTGVTGLALALGIAAAAATMRGETWRRMKGRRRSIFIVTPFAAIFGSNQLNSRWKAGAKSQKIMAMLHDSGPKSPV
jgi:MATE family, multidrug efflux pump